MTIQMKMTWRVLELIKKKPISSNVKGNKFYLKMMMTTMMKTVTVWMMVRSQLISEHLTDLLTEL